MVQRVRLRLRASPSPTLEGRHRPRLTISGSMSANAVTRRYPETEALFDRLQIDRYVEGYETLEELAWRHGVDVAQFIQQLRRTALHLNRE